MAAVRMSALGTGRVLARLRIRMFAAARGVAHTRMHLPIRLIDVGDGQDGDSARTDLQPKALWPASQHISGRNRYLHGKGAEDEEECQVAKAQDQVANAVHSAGAFSLDRISSHPAMWQASR